MRILSSQELAEQISTGTSWLEVKDRRVPVWFWTCCNIVVLSIVGLVRNHSLAIILAIAGLLLLNGVIFFLIASSVGNPVVIIHSTGISFRIRANSISTILGLSRVAKVTPQFVTFAFDEIKHISAYKIEVRYRHGPPQSGDWLWVQPHQQAETELFESLKRLLEGPQTLWILTPHQSNGFYFRWFDSFKPPIENWITELGRHCEFVDTAIRNDEVDARDFGKIGFSAQADIVRRLKALGFGPGAVLLIMSETGVSAESADRFLRNAIVRRDAE